MKFIKQLFSITFIFSFGLITAQDTQDLGPLVTDRPDQTESSSLVTKGYIQVETGAFYKSFEDKGLKTEDFTYNTTLLRFGLLDNLELRLGWDLTDSKTLFNNTEIAQITSFSPLLLGVKIALVEEKGLIPKIAFVGHLNLPFTVKEAIKPQTTGVNFRFLFAHTINDHSSFSYNLGAAWENDSSEANYIYTLAYGYSVTEKIGVYTELYGDFPENNKANHLWDAGITYLLSNNVQLDATVGSSITKGQDILLSAGISFRLPN